ncbi:hypothetical protein NECAME_11862 [Necator americanus]|uniref:Uncharacterized protein n=1 Tax=Necator americanus TaxID=51031 RepID=W2T4P3_NECAM|nr:hypothetical protein NECAME_11862 [Necator americanus]ETN76196.1 hypothetical protein NECAME_11862 [Necator americanus]
MVVIHAEQMIRFLLCGTVILRRIDLSRTETYCIDVWFHGDCILWAPDVQMRGNQLTMLEEKLHEFWKQVILRFYKGSMKMCKEAL